jgi:hypothetical protein
MKKPANDERRHRRSTDLGEALQFQLDACREAGALRAILVSDDMGLCLAESGAGHHQDELAARLPQTVRAGIGSLPTALPAGFEGAVALKRFSVGPSTLFVCAVGGRSEARDANLERAERGFQRILAAC